MCLNLARMEGTELFGEFWTGNSWDMDIGTPKR